jgi:hypothetical protein
MMMKYPEAKPRGAEGEFLGLDSSFRETVWVDFVVVTSRLHHCLSTRSQYRRYRSNLSTVSAFLSIAVVFNVIAQSSSENGQKVQQLRTIMTVTSCASPIITCGARLAPACM